MMQKAVLGLGSNIGNREENLSRAIRAVELLPGTTVIATSHFYETPPFDVVSEQNEYMNCCVQILTEFSPKVLLGACLGIETGMGRERLEYHGARIIDIDLLLYEGQTCNDMELKLPHPQILKRAFVMVPLSDIFPDKVALGLDFSQALAKADASGIKALKKD